MRQLKHPYRWLAVALAIAAVTIAIVLALVARNSLLNSAWVVNALAQHYGVDAEVSAFHASLWPRLAGGGAGLKLGAPGEPPLASVQAFRFQTTWRGLWRRPPHVTGLELDGLDLDVRTGRKSLPASPPAPARRRSLRRPPDFVLDSVIADGTRLRLIPANPAKPSRDIPFQRLRLARAGNSDAPLGFDAVFVNPKPLGTVHAQGSFGPWNMQQAADTPVAGRFVFGPADLGTIRGIAGSLRADGSFQGFLGAIAVSGSAFIPNFSLGHRGHALPMTADFQTLVDGESGDTAIRSVTARLPHSIVHATGRAVRNPGGEWIDLDFTATPARLEDFLALAVSAPQPLLTGDVHMTGSIHLPPGDKPVDERLQLQGHFRVDRAAFTSGETEDKLNRLSRVGQGDGGAADTHTVFNLHGDFTLAGGVAHFSTLEFGTSGADVTLAGDYDLVHESLSFSGHLQLGASLSQMTHGVKSAVLRPFDRFLSGPGGGTRLPLRITGSRNQPQFTVDLRHALHFP